MGFAMCGSFCTHEKVLAQLRELRNTYDITPILSDSAAGEDTRFGPAELLLARLAELTGRAPIRTVPEAEPIGPGALFDVLVIAPCTGNTAAKLAAGVTDTAVTMAAKSCLRARLPVVVCLATNDALGGSAQSLGRLLNTRGVFFVPLRQDDPQGKPTSLVGDFSLVGETVEAALEGRQLQPVFLPPSGPRG